MKTTTTPEVINPDIWRLFDQEERTMWIRKPAYRPQLEIRGRQYLAVLQGVADGRPYKQIAPELHLSFRTLEAYGQHLIKVMHAGSITHCVAKALREGLIK